MGTTSEELGREGVPKPYRDWEQPRHSVVIGADFYMAKYDVTVGEFRAFVRATGAGPSGGCNVRETGTDGTYTWQTKAYRSWENPGFSQTDRDPVLCVSYEDALAYVDWLNGVAKTKPYRLPSEAEWEYAARAGTATARFWGDSRDPACRFANVADLALARRWTVASPNANGYFSCDDNFAFTSPVGTFQPNGFGLYDMLGNVWQWTADCANEDHKEALLDGSVRRTGDCSRRILRGGSWFNDPWIVRAGSRFRYLISYRSTDVGFRLARTL